MAFGKIGCSTQPEIAAGATSHHVDPVLLEIAWNATVRVRPTRQSATDFSIADMGDSYNSTHTSSP
jgi:hypothetical protein